MGNKQQKIQFGLQEHERLGLLKILDQPDNQQQYQKVQIQRTVMNEKYYNDWLHKIKLIDTEMNRQILYLPTKHSFNKEGYCGFSGVAHLEYQYFPFLLKNQIKNRRNLNQYFQETQIWYLLYKMVHAASVFQQLKQKIGDFNPKNILLNQNGEIRIISTLSIPNQIDNYQKIVQDILADVYLGSPLFISLAPQQISQKSIQKGTYPSNINPNSAQMFCIGITLLQAASLQNCSFIYTRNSLKIQLQKLQKIKSIANKRYSGFLNQILQQMTEVDPRKRRTGNNLVQILRPYQKSILDLQPINYSTILHSSVKISAFFDEGTQQSKYNIAGKY